MFAHPQNRAFVRFVMYKPKVGYLTLVILQNEAKLIKQKPNQMSKKGEAYVFSKSKIHVYLVM